MEALDINYLWKDRKRILGMPISFTRYRLSDDRLFLETGFFNIRSEEILLYRIRDISLSLKFTQRIFGVGSVMVQSTDKSLPQLELKNIKQPREVKELLHKQVEEMKVARKMRVGEIMGDGAFSDDNHSDDAEL
ncbi:MAG: PH domain-containing protein, partial [Lachnospiraceae bacterium]|nr:PH domain-containing protein [Lachnospiraceae bacterium]